MKQLWYFVISFLLCVNSFAAIVDNKSVIVVINDPPPSTKKSFLNVEATSIAISPFYQYLGLGISYERHILGDWHWTVLDYHKFDHQGTNTESDLKKDFKIQFQENPYLDQYVGTGLTYKPFHFKWMFKNQKSFWSTINFNFEYGKAKWSTIDAVSFVGLGTNFELTMKNEKTYYLKLLNITFLDSTIEPEFSLSLGVKIEI